MNKEININNYEEFVLDYLEQNLDNSTNNKFELFIEQNPKIKEEINDLLSYSAEPINTSFNKKLHLKKSKIENISYFGYLCISDIENTITTDEKNELEKIFVESPELLLDYEQYTKTKLQAHKNITFPNKNKLKRTHIVNIKTVSVTISALAAILIIFFGIKSFSFNNNNQANMCSNLSEINFFRTFIPTSNDSIITQKATYYYSNNQIIAEQQTIDTIPTDLQFDNSQEEIIVAENVIQKSNDIQLTNLGNSSIELPNTIPQKTITQNNIDIIGKAEESLAPQNIVNFIVNQYNTLTENEASVKIDFDKNNKCYGIEINEKKYEVCFDDKFGLNNF